MTDNSVVRARIDERTKQEAARATSSKRTGKTRRRTRAAR